MTNDKTVMMRIIPVIVFFAFLTIWEASTLPVTPSKKPTEEKKDEQPAVEEAQKPHYVEEYDPNDPRASIENVLEYNNYLKEVVNALESDSEFREKLNKLDEVDIRTGKIAQELEYVNHNVRTKLDEIKRTELERLRKLAIKQFEMSNDIDREHLKIPEHLDHSNQHTFEVEDLKKLIHKASNDLAEADRLRREEFKRYEMQKEFEKQEKLRGMDEEHRKKFEEEEKKMREKHNKHEPVHHPGGKAQLEEVWEKQDHMTGQEFDPKSFFMMHDLDGNGFWDEMEVKALFVKELDKVYQQGVPEDDMKERAEEMERMREHVFREADTNRDSLISYEEFLEQTRREEFKRDDGWDTVDNQPQYTHEEYLEFERKRQEEIQRLISQGMLPPHPNMPQGYYPGPQGPYQAPHQAPHHQGGYQQQHPNQIPQNVHPNQMSPQQNFHPNQIPQQQNFHPNQIPQNVHPNQIPQQQNFHPNQIPQQHPNAQQFQPPPVPQNPQQVPQQMPPQIPPQNPPQQVVSGVGQKQPQQPIGNQIPPQVPPPQAQPPK
ncbi:nucleobindin-2 [Lutzomyia longipalpis]|uniref:nucleobindin-2 n=1 Tax=Lutzomyia longipalpis TaxID=7200 RepID=UPI002483BD73|nr:nucleobindin-2 [Lutzomyia longipalpis]